MIRHIFGALQQYNEYQIRRSWSNRSHLGSPARQCSVNQVYKGQWRLYKMIGLDVYNQNDEKVGDISELRVDQTGKIQTAILGVGGFLGVGERLVSVNFDQLKFVNQPVELKIASSTPATAAPTKNSDIATQSRDHSASIPKCQRTVVSRSCGNQHHRGSA